MAYGTINTDKLVGSSGGTLSPDSGVFRNRIINGAMVIDQRNAGASVTSGFPVDRWQLGQSQSSKLTAQQNAGSVTPPAGFSKYLGITSSSAYSVTSSDYFLFAQGVEGFNAADFNWGTASASTVTLSFWVRSSLTGSFGASIKNGTAARSYPFNYTISSANTWEQKTITIPGDTSGTWATDNSGWGYINFTVGSGSTRLSTANTWASGNYDGATGATSVVGTNGATWYITGVQLEKGSTATSFDFRDYGRELAMCQRYYEVAGAGAAGKANSAGNTGDHGICVSYKVAKRATPTLSITSGTNALVIPQVNIYSISAITGANGTVNGAYFNVTTTASLGATNVPLIGYNDAWLAVSSEL